MITLKWLKGMFTRRSGRLAGAIGGIAVTISLLASLGTFTAYHSSQMTLRAIENVPVDWQVQLVPGTDQAAVEAALRTVTQVGPLETVGYADTSGFETNTDNTVQTTGSGKALGISDSYFKNFPGEVRFLQGAESGVLVMQQTAANLHVHVGDSITVKREGLPSVSVTVDGIVDLPNADSLFQAIGLPAGAAPQAPPDNVVLLPTAMWHQYFDQQAQVRPDSVRTQLHTVIDHSFSANPSLAYQAVLQRANNLEARIAGSGTIGNNLAARLSAAREDALYAQVLFLFLGMPGVLLAALMTLFIVASGAGRRRQEQAALKIYGASAGRILYYQALEAVGIGIPGVLLGIAATKLAISLMLPAGTELGGMQWLWITISSLVGLLLAFAAVLYPAWRTSREMSVAKMVASGRGEHSLWQKFGLDILLLAVAATEFLRTASTGYQVVLAPEGVTAISVNYEAFLAPLFLWLGAALLAVRLYRVGLGRGKGVIPRVIRPVAGPLSGIVASSLSRERQYLLRGIVFVLLAVSFAVSTAVFNTTYNAQARVDAQLTNGADVTVTGIIPFTADDARLTSIKSVPGVSGVQLMQHRFAYVGNDLQDMYGIDAAHIGDATTISDAYFANGDAKTALSQLANNKDGVLVSQETVNDYQLQPGDLINLRLQDAEDHQYHVVPFHFLGVVREFPTAPKDSFLVANAGYIAQMTHNTGYELTLVKTAANPAETAGKITAVLNSSGVKVSDLTSTMHAIGSSLTSVDLNGLTSLELAYAVLLAVGAVGLVLALGLAERKRNFAILQAIGAKRHQLRAFISSEALLVLLSGGSVGVLLGTGIAWMLVKVLTGVFDPPPEALSAPWNYLLVLATCSIVATFGAIAITQRISARPAVEELKNSLS